ncbi:N-acetylmuramoyl-L-alanine amidase family protein [Candidatus Weimeria sp. HCP3S3_B5]|uniref:N-acetylmuramoyl-L-alanine amidase family protein n=1 Tax=Candidatus Weimeria sp. HCP3S3_B5 TaxID=3438871 RepID=UPI003F89EAB3
MKRHIIRISGLLIAICMIIGLGICPAQAAKRKRSQYTIGIDPGHQRYGDSSTEPSAPGSRVRKAKVAGGTRGRYTGLPEYKLTLQVAKKLKQELKDRGYKVVMTRSRNDVNISNSKRAKKLNRRCDIAIRLHADGGASSAHGASMQCSSRNNRYVGHLYSKCNRLSRDILRAYCSETGMRSRGIAYRDDLTGTNFSTIPVTLIEMGFMTNRSDDRYMAKSSNQYLMAEGIANGVDDYFGF